ncbi:lysM domain receptor-like kinase 3 [Apium graveolens]|uniref:lysM domain receptor-like kinase 3 n=1 Tax=Apium graveolens TaxID=4045 RepID=UPI003D7B877B
MDVNDSWTETGKIEIGVANQFVGRGQYNAKRVIAYNRAAADAYTDIDGLRNSAGPQGSACRRSRSAKMAPFLPGQGRCAQYGDVSPKFDVYAFEVVLYELISFNEVIVKASSLITESKELVALLAPKDDLSKLVDPRLGDNYLVDSVSKMAQLDKACTQENPQLQPSMRSIFVALMTLSWSQKIGILVPFMKTMPLSI